MKTHIKKRCRIKSSTETSDIRPFIISDKTILFIVWWFGKKSRNAKRKIEKSIQDHMELYKNRTVRSVSTADPGSVLCTSVLMHLLRA